MMWIIDIALGFALGYLYAFVKYKKRELKIVMKPTDEKVRRKP